MKNICNMGLHAVTQCRTRKYPQLRENSPRNIGDWNNLCSLFLIDSEVYFYQCEVAQTYQSQYDPQYSYVSILCTLWAKTTATTLFICHVINLFLKFQPSFHHYSEKRILLHAKWSNFLNTQQNLQNFQQCWGKLKNNRKLLHKNFE